jgi:hypothetical protein
MPRGQCEPSRRLSNGDNTEDKLRQAARFRRYAAQCIELAREKAHADDKARLLHLAEAWRRRAGELEETNSDPARD